MKTVIKNSLKVLVLLVAVALPLHAKATVTSDMQTLVSQANSLQSQLVDINLTADVICAPLVTAGQATGTMLESIEAVNGSLVAPITIDDSLMTALEDLSMTNVQISDQALRLGADLQLLAPSVDALSIKDGLTAMLQLSDDIGAMADRIGEMADKILIMADNIGVMADRIMLTQEIQSQNLALTQQSVLQTQTNMLTLVSVAETASYDLDLNSLVMQGELLAADLAATVFSPFTVKYQLADAADDVHAFLAQVKAMEDSLEVLSAGSTVTVDSSTLTSLVNLSIMAASVSTVLDGYILAVESMQSVLSDQSLDASLTSMLEMSADIGMLANSILEMADLILVMADNIGMTADQIILTQELQSGYLAISQTSILATQEMAIGIIVAQSL